MRLLTDFDGVWTDPAREAGAIARVVEEELGGPAGLAPEEVRARLGRVAAGVRARPERHGWVVGGALSAFADEDPFCFWAGVYDALAASTDPELEPLARAMAPHGGPGRFGAHCYERGVALALREHGPPIHAGARRLAELLLAVFDEVVVASNSRVEKLVLNFAHAGITPGEGAHRRLRLVGDARKFALAPEPPPPRGVAEREFAGRRVRLDRGPYHALLRAERPSALVGDVFSLDLALPLALRESDPAFACELALLCNDYTPAWTLEAIAGRPGTRVVASLEELAESFR